MKRTMLVAGGVVIAVLVLIVAVWAGGSSDSAKTSQGKKYKVVAACDAFTLKDAEAVLGQGTKASTANGQSDSQTSDINLSTCSYHGVVGLAAEDTKTVTILSRSAKSAVGAESNRSVFGQDKPIGKQDVSGIGDAAFWDAELSQLDILKGNNWYIIGNMSGTNANSGKLEVSRAVYNQIKQKL